MDGKDIFEYFKFKLKDIPIKDSYWFFIFDENSNILRLKMNFSVSFLTENEANFICQLFTNSSNYKESNKYGDILSPKEYVDYLTFQCSIDDNYIYEDGVLDGRFIVQIKVNDLIQFIRDDKLNSIFNI
jgi:hypothetical protein